jgi:ATP-binding cassette, subfamily B, multidrug efflux pump
MAATDLEPLHEEDALGKAYDARLMRRLLRYLQPYRWKVALGVAMLLLVAALELIGPYLTMVALDRAIPNGDLELLWILAIAYFGALLFAFALEYGQQILTTWLGQRIMFDLRRQIFAHVQRQGLRFFDRNPVGRLMTRVTNDVEVLNQLFSAGIVTVFGDVFTLVFIVGVMLWLDWRLALVALAVMPFVIIVAFVFPFPGPRSVPRDPRPHRTHQCVPPGAHHRRFRGPAVRPGEEGHRPVRRHQP